MDSVRRPSFDFHTGLNESIVTSSVSKSVSTKPCGAGGFAGLCGSPKSGRSSSPATSGGRDRGTVAWCASSASTCTLTGVFRSWS